MGAGARRARRIAFVQSTEREDRYARRSREALEAAPSEHRGAWMRARVLDRPEQGEIDAKVAGPFEFRCIVTRGTDDSQSRS